MSANNSLGVPSRLRNYSYLQLDGYVTTGSTGGLIFSALSQNTGSAFVYVNDAVNGAIITVGEDGVYSGSCTFSGGSDGSFAGVAVVYNDPTFSEFSAGSASVASSQRLAYAGIASGGSGFTPITQASFCRPLPAGTKIYIIPAGAASQPANVRFSICRVDY